nr:uncharacterized protein TEX48 isoform X2 [Odocoileus virginianus texanus]
MAHQNLASKIFSLCCKCCEKPNAADDSKIPNQTQELQLSKHGVQKDELNRQSLKHSDAAPCMSLGKATLPSEKTTSCFSSSEYGCCSYITEHSGQSTGVRPACMILQAGNYMRSRSPERRESMSTLSF